MFFFFFFFFFFSRIMSCSSFSWTRFHNKQGLKCLIREATSLFCSVLSHCGKHTFAVGAAMRYGENTKH